MNPKTGLAIGGLAALSLLAGTTHGASGTDNYIVTSLERIDDCTDPSAAFALLVDVYLTGTNASTVVMETAAGLRIDLENEGDGEWFGEEVYSDLPSLANETNGLWTVTITGGSAASTSIFTLDVADMDLLDFYAPPANVLPASGPIPPDVTFTWDDPTGAETPDVLYVDTDYQDAELPIGDTAWTPPLPLTTGPNSFAVVYSYAELGAASLINVSQGTITWGTPPFAPAGYPDRTPLATFGGETIRCYDVQEVSDANTIEIALERIDDFVFPGNEFISFMDIQIADPTVTGVNLVTAGGLDVDLEFDEDLWCAELGFANLAAMISAMNGQWTLTVEGPSPSVSTFVMNIGGLLDGDFFDVPSNLSPGHGDAGIPADVVLSWDDPTPPGTADVLFVETNEFDADTIDGTIDIDATSWMPPVPLDRGYQEFFVGYARFAAFGGPISVDPPGAIAWGLPPFAPPGHPANTPLCFIGSETAVEFIVGEPAEIVIALERADDPELGPFAAFIDLELPGLAPTNVEVRTPFLVIPLEEQESGSWEADLPFSDVATMRDALNGGWFIEVFGENYSLSQFHVDLSTLVDDDFFPTPTDVFPARGATGVPEDVTISWSDPTGGMADLLFVEVSDQEAGTFDGTLDISDESWMPPLALVPGFHDLFVGYFRAAAPGIASPIYSDGAIAWVTHQFAPPGYPERTPLVAYGSETTSFFEVGVVDCPADVSGDGVVGFADVLAMLAAWGPCEGCPADADNNGEVGFSDVLLVLANWGDC